MSAIPLGLSAILWAIVITTGVIFGVDLYLVGASFMAMIATAVGFWAVGRV